MRCPRCGCQEDRVIDSRASKDGAAVRRRRECAACGHRFTTHEEIIQAELKVDRGFAALFLTHKVRVNQPDA